VHWGAEILRHFVPQNDRIGGKDDRLGFVHWGAEILSRRVGTSSSE
jgi:hypothetical protein